MRRQFFLMMVLLLLCLTGCSQKTPITAHGQPVDHWLAELACRDAKARKKAVTALGHVGKADPNAIPALVKHVNDPDRDVRVEAIVALLNIGPAAKGARAALTEATKDKDAKVRSYAEKALKVFQPSP